ncbi:putative regulatory protein, TetR family [uncultured Pleomorphomonas sp.]|uniref:Putative regulatory protein, TetR family n=1 Tax=uncultured Pleomorphomonas sp. TaxID=442121 RepID=A0A212L1G3_9HYPH|nr:TetR/AcrR family transcriptional regulator [uncultured Pleomorphomonas sp.]SCM71372.1 putative regulatory protein, TetR family [uncultured Pleomorphomonas sp.]
MDVSGSAPQRSEAPASPRSEALSAQQDERRARILDAARTCFSRAGFHRTSMQEICAEAKMSPGGLYRYFASKDAIIEAIAQEEQLAGRRILEILLEPGTLHDRLLRSGLAYIEAMRDRRAVQMMLEVYVESMRNTAVGAFFANCEEENRRLFEGAFSRAKATGEIAADADVDTMMMTLVAFADGIVLRMGLNPDYDVERAEALLSRVVTAVLQNEGPPLESRG